MALAIIPKDEESMKQFIGKTREWIDGFKAGIILVEGKLNNRLDKAIDDNILNTLEIDWILEGLRNGK